MRKHCKRKVWNLVNPIQHASRAAIQHAAQELHGVVHGGRLQLAAGYAT